MIDSDAVSICSSVKQEIQLLLGLVRNFRRGKGPRKVELGKSDLMKEVGKRLPFYLHHGLLKEVNWDLAKADFIDDEFGVDCIDTMLAKLAKLKNDHSEKVLQLQKLLLGFTFCFSEPQKGHLVALGAVNAPGAGSGSASAAGSAQGASTPAARTQAQMSARMASKLNSFFNMP